MTDDAPATVSATVRPVGIRVASGRGDWGKTHCDACGGYVAGTTARLNPADLVTMQIGTQHRFTHTLCNSCGEDLVRLLIDQLYQNTGYKITDVTKGLIGPTPYRDYFEALRGEGIDPNQPLPEQLR